MFIMKNTKEVYFEKGREDLGILGDMIEEFAKEHPEEFVKSAHYYFIKILFNCYFNFCCVDNDKLQKLVSESLEELEPTERQLIRISFGLDDGHILGLDAAQQLNISKEEAEIMISRIFKKLRQPDKIEALDNFLQDRLDPEDYQN